MLEHDWIDSSFRPGHDGVRVMPLHASPTVTPSSRSLPTPPGNRAPPTPSESIPADTLTPVPAVLYLQALQPEPGHDEITPYPSAAARSRRETARSCKHHPGYLLLAHRHSHGRSGVERARVERLALWLYLGVKTGGYGRILAHPVSYHNVFKTDSRSDTDS
jgi:hypothetical protein